MTHDQLIRKLNSVGKACFVRYYKDFSDRNVPSIDIKRKLQRETSYTENSCSSRTTHARAIINAGKGIEALKICAYAGRSDPDAQSAAAELLHELDT